MGIVNEETGTVTNEQGKFILLVKPENQKGILPHHAGWITVNLQQYNITLKEDFVVIVEWDGTREHNTSSLMAFATLPKGQVIYYRESNLKPWKIVKSSLIDIKSIGMYATVWYEK